MSKSLAYSRWRRLPSLHRVTEHRLPDHRSEPQRLTLYVPGWVLDEAERLARQEGQGSVQEYCEGLLREAIARKLAPPERSEPSFSSRLDLDEIASSFYDVPDRLTDGEPGSEPERQALEAPNRPEEREMGEEAPPTEAREAVEVVLRHAGYSEGGEAGLLPRLRRGEAIAPPSAEELLRALVVLEQALRDQPRIDRRLAYALYRLAFESQVLLTDAWPALASDQATLDVLRMVQESVERVLSGEDIRYYAPGSSEEPES